MADPVRPESAEDELRENLPPNELEREERRLERLRLVTSSWPMPSRFTDFEPDPREAA